MIEKMKKTFHTRGTLCVHIVKLLFFVFLTLSKKEAQVFSRDAPSTRCVCVSPSQMLLRSLICSATGRGGLMSTFSPHRGIIVTTVFNPLSRGESTERGDNRQGEIARSEDIAIAQFNRVVREEQARGVLSPNAMYRSKKRFQRHTKPFQQRRVAASKREFKHYVTRMSTLMNWISYRRRRS